MKTLLNIVHGSHLYGLNTESSDIDYKGVYLPDTDNILLGNYQAEIRRSTGDSDSKNTKDDIDEVYFSLPKFINMACDGETIAFDMLHCAQPLETSNEWEFIRDHRHLFYTKNMKAFLGYCKKQAAKYGIKGSRLEAIETSLNTVKKHVGYSIRLSDMINDLQYLQEVYPEHIKIYYGFQKGDKWVDKSIFELCGSKYDLTSKVNYVVEEINKKYESYGHRARQAKENQGIDWKALSHALRAAYQLKEIYTEGDLKYPLKNRELLLKVKKGELDYTFQVAPELERAIEEVELLSIQSNLPANVNRKFWNDWLLSVYKSNMK